MIKQILAWLNLDFYRWLIPIGLVAALVAGWLLFIDNVQSEAVDNAENKWRRDQLEAEAIAADRAAEAFSRSTAKNTIKQRELNDAASKGDDSPVGPGTNAVLDRLSGKASNSR